VWLIVSPRTRAALMLSPSVASARVAASRRSRSLARQADSIEGRQQLDIVFRRLHQVREVGAAAGDLTAETGEAFT